MPFNGSGIYNLPSTTVTPAVTGTTIDSSEFNTFTADLATALTLCIAKDGQTASPTLTSPIINQILDSNSNEILEFDVVASAVNHIQVFNEASGADPGFSIAGEANKGYTFNDSNGNQILTMESVASAVNRISIYNEATGNAPGLQSKGEANTGLALLDSNTNIVNLLNSTASAVNYLTTTNAAAGNAVQVGVAGADPAIDLELAGKGAGGVYGGINTHASSPFATTSGSTVSITGIPSWAKRITLSFNGVSTNGTNTVFIRLGDAGGIELTGYDSICSYLQASAQGIGGGTGAFSIDVTGVPAAADTRHGHVVITLVDETNFDYVYSSTITNGADTMYSGAGNKSLNTVLTQIDIITADTFDAGEVSVHYEG